MYDKAIHHRHSIRIPGYDYSIPDFYFVTICTQNKQCLFGHIRDGVMILNDTGRIAYDSWKWLEQQYPQVRLHDFVIMPNHMHGIIEIIDQASVVEARRDAPDKRAAHEPPLRIKPIGQLVGAYKTVSTKQINMFTEKNDKIWQRNYYEHIIRDDNDYKNIKNYIATNPQTWNADALFVKSITEFNAKYS